MAEAFRNFLDVVWRPTRYLHVEVKPYPTQCLINLLEGLTAKRRYAQYVSL